MSVYEEMLAVFKAGFRARFDAPGLLRPEGDEAVRAGVRAVVDELVKERDRDSHIIAREFRRAVKADKRCARLEAALAPFAAIKADDGDTFDTWHDDVIIRCEVTVGDLKKARFALEAKQ